MAQLPRSRRLRAAVVLALAGALVGGPAMAGDLDDIRDRIRQVERQERATEQDRGTSKEKAGQLKGDLEHTSAELDAADARLRETTVKVENARVVLSEAEADLADAEAEAARIETELARARADEAAIQESIEANADEQQRSRATVGAIARDSYKNGGMGSLATTLELLSGEADAVDQMAMTRTVLRLQDQQIRALATAEAEAVVEQDRLAGVRGDIAYLLAKAEATVVAKDQARAAADEAKRSLEDLEARQAGEKAALETEKARVRAALDAERKRSDELAAQLEELASAKHGLKVEEKQELRRIAEEEARRKAAEEARRKAAEEAARQRAAEEAARQRAAEREARRQRELAAEAQRLRDQQRAEEAQRRAEQAERDAEAARQAKQQADERQSRIAASRSRAVAPPAPAPAVASGYLSYPMNAPSTSEFGNRLHPVLGIWLLHSGLDFGAPCGTPVLAAADGVVFGTLYDGSRGNYVVLDHGVQKGVNLTTAYLHLETFAVSSGQSVSRGQVIGYEGTTGTSTGCHLHFETRENGTPVNPRGWLG